MSKTTGLFMTVLLVSILAIAASTEPRRGGEKEITTVAEARTMRDGAKVHLEGYVVKPLEDGHFLFRDQTGEIDCEIPEDVWGDLKPDPKAKLHLYGEVDRDERRVRIEVKRLKALTEDKPRK